MEVSVNNESLVDFDSDYVSFTDKSDLKSDENSASANSLLTLLDDKNRSIALLKKQVHNQKVQLGFYLHRVLNGKKVLQLADNCIPQETEENMQLNLAMSRFCKHAGLKSRIMSLHGRMVDLEKRLMRVAVEQEGLIQKAFAKLIELAKKGNGTDENVVLSFLADMNSEQVDTLVKILESTNKLRKDLDMFRTCCDRLIVIEDERNALVEQVYAMPVAQRLNYGVLLAAQYEKIRLEKEIEEIKRDQFMLQEKLCLIQSRAPSATSFKSVSDLGDVQKMLEAVNYEAIDLLTLAKEQKDKYTNEINKLKGSNASLLKQVIASRAVAKDKEALEFKLASAMQELRTVKEAERNKTKSYSRKLEELHGENAALTEKLKHYCCIEEQVKCLLAQVENVDSIRNERDHYKAQVEDLPAIRAAYEQLVGNHQNYEERMRKQAEKIEDLERIRQRMDLELKNKAEVVTDQDKQIKHLLLIIQKMAAHKGCETNTVYSQTSLTRQASVTPRNWMSPRSNDELATASRFLQNTCILAKQEEEFCRANAITFPKTVQSSLMSATSVEIQSVNSEGKTESLKATLKSSTCLEGTIQVSNSSTLSFNLSCKKMVADEGPASSNDELEPVTCENNILDEFELMKDSSRETVAVRIASIDECDVEQERVEVEVENACSQDDALRGNAVVNEESQDDEDAKSTRAVDLEVDAISGQLQQLTTDLDETLSRPDGKDILVNTMRTMYNHVCFLKK